MADELQLRRGTTAMLNNKVGAFSEVMVDTNTKELRVFDGETIGGFSIARRAFTTVEHLQQSTELNWPVGHILSAGGYSYSVAALDADDFHLVSNLGLKLYVLPDADGWTHLAALGVDSSGADDARAAFLRLLYSDRVKKIRLPIGIIRFDASVIDTAYNRSMIIGGHGMARTTVQFSHAGRGIELKASHDPENFRRHTVEMMDFKVTRVGQDMQTGLSGLHNLSLSGYVDPKFERIESEKALGMAILHSRSLRPVVRDCLAHDSISQSTGTDGIHFTHCTNPRAEGNEVWSVHDDPLSFGAYTVMEPYSLATTNVYAANNRLRDCIGSLKIYGNVLGAIIDGTVTERLNQGGITLMDHANTATNFISGIKITNWIARDCRGPGAEIAGALRIRANVLSEPTYTTRIEDVSVDGASVIRCRTIAYANAFLGEAAGRSCANISLRNIECDEIVFGEEASSSNSAMQINGLSGTFELENIRVGSMPHGFIFLSGDAPRYDNLVRIRMKNVRVAEWNTVQNSSSHCINLQTFQGITLDLDAVTLANSTPSGALALFARAVNMDSVFRDFYREGEDTGIGGDVDGFLAGLRRERPRTFSTLPAAGTFFRGEIVYDSTATTVGWLCTSEGTFNSLFDVTYDAVAGSRQITVSDASDLKRGQYLDVGGRKRVEKIVGTVVTLEKATVSDATDAALSYFPPTLIALG